MTAIWVAIIAAVGGLWFGWQFVRGVRTGKTASRSGPIERARSPMLFWLMMAIHCAGGMILPAIAIRILMVNVI